MEAKNPWARWEKDVTMVSTASAAEAFPLGVAIPRAQITKGPIVRGRNLRAYEDDQPGRDRTIRVNLTLKQRPEIESLESATVQWFLSGRRYAERKSSEIKRRYLNDSAVTAADVYEVYLRLISYLNEAVEGLRSRTSKLLVSVGRVTYKTREAFSAIRFDITVALGLMLGCGIDGEVDVPTMTVDDAFFNAGASSNSLPLWITDGVVRRVRITAKTIGLPISDGKGMRTLWIPVNACSFRTAGPYLPGGTKAADPDGKWWCVLLSKGSLSTPYDSGTPGGGSSRSETRTAGALIEEFLTRPWTGDVMCLKDRGLFALTSANAYITHGGNAEVATHGATFCRVIRFFSKRVALGERISQPGIHSVNSDSGVFIPKVASAATSLTQAPERIEWPLYMTNYALGYIPLLLTTAGKVNQMGETNLTFTRSAPFGVGTPAGLGDYIEALLVDMSMLQNAWSVVTIARVECDVANRISPSASLALLDARQAFLNKKKYAGKLVEMHGQEIITYSIGVINASIVMIWVVWYCVRSVSPFPLPYGSVAPLDGVDALKTAIEVTLRNFLLDRDAMGLKSVVYSLLSQKGRLVRRLEEALLHVRSYTRPY